MFIEYPKNMTPQEIFNSIEQILQDLLSIESKGYLNTIDLKQFPVINQFIAILTDSPEFINGFRSMESYKWIYNLLLINLYELSTTLLKNTESEIETDFYNDLLFLNKRLFNSLDPSIRKSLQKRGISIIQYVQTGFDTEYVNQNALTNSLLSVQLAVNTQSYLKIPKVLVYNLSSINPLTDESYPIQESENFGYGLVEESIRRIIERIRLVKYPGMDSCIESLTNEIKKLDFINYFEKDDTYIFRFPVTPIKRFIHLTDDNGYTFEEMIAVSNILGIPDVDTSYSRIIHLLELLYTNPDSSSVKDLFEYIQTDEVLNNDNIPLPDGYKHPVTQQSLKSYIEQTPKPLTRKYENCFSPVKVSVTRVRNNIFIGHLTPADLSILKDFTLFKDELDIVNKSFVTLGKPINFANSRIMIRDTMLLAPASKKSLSSIGKLYDLKKYELSESEIRNMDLLLKDDPSKFIEYAIRDAVITLTHACWMESFHFSLKGIGIPLTLSGLGNKFVEKQWVENDYKGFQISPNYLIGDSSRVQTPLGLQNIGKTGLKLSLYIGNYKGGRNESFMYGIDTQTQWFDYDLTSAYTTVLFKIGHPDYENGKSLTIKELYEMSNDDLLFSFTIIKCTFSFPSTVKYPSIPVYINETTTVYPLNGEAFLTGAEFILARNQACQFQILEIYHIPFSGDQYPFKEIINEIQSKRRSFPKGTISNLMYKEIGNSIYGSLVRGMSDKRKFDNKTGTQIRIPAHFLSNPILASWVTGFIRSLVGECLHAVQKLNGKVVSVTTDGFITDINDLEKGIIDVMNSDDSFLLSKFKELRGEISNDDTALEIKHEGKGIISWSTRGQLGIDSNIKATTGFQNRNYSHSELVELFSNIMNSDERTLEYIQSSLRSALSISKNGGHVTMIYKDQKFSLKYDNRRLIIDNFRVINPYSSIDEELTIEKHFKSIDDNFVHIKTTQTDLTNKFFFDSMPVKDSSMCRNLRLISSTPRLTEYNQKTSSIVKNTYRNYKDLGIRNLIKGIISNPPIYPYITSELNTYDSIIDFIHNFDPKFKVSKTSLSNLKNRKMIFKQVPRTIDTLKFCDYVKTHFPQFDESKFFQ